MKLGQKSMRQPLHGSWLLTWDLLRTLRGRRRLAIAGVPHGPVPLVQPTIGFTPLGAIRHRTILGVGGALVMSRVVGHECGRVHAHLRERSWCDATRVHQSTTASAYPTGAQVRSVPSQHSAQPAFASHYITVTFRYRSAAALGREPLYVPNILLAAWHIFLILAVNMPCCHGACIFAGSELERSLPPDLQARV